MSNSVVKNIDYYKVTEICCNSLVAMVKTSQEEKTERARIRAQLELATEIIRSDQERFMAYLNNEYKDKDRLYTQAEKMIDKGLEENNLDILNTGCNFMMAAFNKNPLENYKSSIDFSDISNSFLSTNFNKMIEE